MFDVHVNAILKHVLQIKHSSCTQAIYADCGKFPTIITEISEDPVLAQSS